VESNTVVKEFKTNGAEHELIKSRNNLIYQKKDKDNKFEKFKF
jgi:hypothetical protein